MASFLSSAQKQTIDSVLDCLHDTFASDVFVYIEKQDDVSADVNYNALYSASNIQPSASYNKTLARHAIKARVKYFADQGEEIFTNNIPDSKGRVRLKVLPVDYELIKICTKVEIGEDMYIVDGDASIEGIFSKNYYTVILKREN